MQIFSFYRSYFAEKYFRNTLKLLLPRTESLKNVILKKHRIEKLKNISLLTPKFKPLYTVRDILY